MITIAHDAAWFGLGALAGSWSMVGIAMWRERKASKLQKDLQQFGNNSYPSSPRGETTK